MRFSKNIFEIQNGLEFEKLCLEVFQFQYQNVDVYRRFVDYLKLNVADVTTVQKIPFLPIEMFKHHKIVTKNHAADHYFQSSGTTNIQTRSRHYIADFHLYDQSLIRSFSYFIGDPKDYIFLGLLPNYSENQHSSLIYMVDQLMSISGVKENGYFLYNHRELFEILTKNPDKKILLFGVSFALLDFLDFIKEKNLIFPQNPDFTIIETGGMKGRKTEMTKTELLKILKDGFATKNIFSEYSMTELLSQAYSLGDNIYETPNWMKILIRSTGDPFSYVEPGRTGAINIIDLANRNSCAFIATQDLGNLATLTQKKSIHPAFSVQGRIDHSDIRGCSLLVV